MKLRNAACLVTWLVAVTLASTLAFGAAETTKVTAVKGQLVSVDETSRMLTVKAHDPDGSTHDMAFSVSDEVKILKGGAPIGLADLKPGDQITVTFKEADDKNVVFQITVEPAP